MKRSTQLEHAHEGKRRKLVGKQFLPAYTYGPMGSMTLINGMYWCPVTGEAWAVMMDAGTGEFQLYATGLYFTEPFTRLTRGSVRMLAALINAAGHAVAIEEQPDGDTVLLVTDHNGHRRRVSAALLAANTGRYACSVHAMVRTVAAQVSKVG